MKIIFHKNFDKQYKKLNKKEQKKVQNRLSKFAQDPFAPLLNNHPLRGRYTDYRSINITGDLRAIYKFNGKDQCIFVAVDTHSNLY
ncbi:MAG: type II toxin-antitoxin system mRNA interferase toxin, RelE/StbE family [Patescibacteria group bacterium]|nr:type II toxin-antitoxin system mRNA interferase toxin, RelE/StbE family [Patescibacteria group bacterium]MBU1350083.1 type II toxin-antitoxin system mRNA interferase toxin, RelE/StbE family [Patescibacteria group bacterium]MBU1421262.1 type II toxin-antitoxin system mRNA interferase toxin, RelE/StbE family [Patescibacteria group bacterium]MBU1987765.1 type II toxin-antitoxin system mRNA interferase toxin, RelE/StbE family [Patescibacteria group bacterium]MBU2416004.1 type II toxin-antitoxin 